MASLAMKTLHRRGITQSSNCTRCSVGVEETVVHCIRDCNVPRQMWQQLGMSSPAFFQYDDFMAWQQEMLAGDNVSLFLAGIWRAWCARNAKCLGVKIFTCTKSLEK